MVDRSLLAAVSGIDANQTFLDVIANNIANSNTTGYKADSATFDDLLAQQIEGASAPNGIGLGGVNALAVGSGVRVGAVNANFSEGTFQQTNSPTDVAIQGQGLFVVNFAGQQVYTRDGHLLLDANGNLVTATGGLVQGWQAGPGGVINTNANVGNIQIPFGASVPPNATANVNMGGNLPSSLDGTGNSETTTGTVFDTLGNAIPVTFTYTDAGIVGGNNEWQLTATIPDPGGGNQNILATNPTTLDFDPATGQLVNVNGAAVSATVPTAVQTVAINNGNAAGTTGTAGNLPAFNINFPIPGTAGAVTNFAAPDSAQVTSQDGFTTGNLSGISVGNTGIITGSYTNGHTQSLGQIAIALFANENGLDKIGDNYWAQTANSGIAVVDQPGVGGAGTLVGGVLESSNVDMGHELTNLVIAQTSYQANTHVVTSNDQVLQALINMA